MRRLLLIIFLLLSAIGAQAQSRVPHPGEPPVLARISISAPTSDGMVTITGSNGAVFPNAYVAVRNLYTGATVYTQAGETGSFSAQIAGSPSTPFWISPSTAKLPPERKDTPGSLPGGPGAILYSPLRAATPAHAADHPDRHRRRPDRLGRLPRPPSDSTPARAPSMPCAITNRSTSPSLAVTPAPLTRRLEIRFTIDTNTYTVTLDPRQMQPAALARVNPIARDLGDAGRRRAPEQRHRTAHPAVVPQPRRPPDARPVRWLDADGVEISSDTHRRGNPQARRNRRHFPPAHRSGSRHAFDARRDAGQTGAVWSAQRARRYAGV